MTRPIVAEISKSALQANYARAKTLAPKSKALAVIKANGYGHGVERVAAALAEKGVDGFALVELEYALKLRENRHEQPILLIEGLFEPAELMIARQFRLSVVVHCEDQLAMLESSRGKSPIDVYLKFNTGMNRLGFTPADAKQAIARAEALMADKQIGTLTLMTHFAQADELDVGVDEQYVRFSAICQGTKHPRSMSNSAALFRYRSTHVDVVRPGIMLYGASPFADQAAQSLHIKPAMRVTSQLIAIQHLKPGDAVGYGAVFRAEKPTVVGVVACGYADGYPRHAPTGTPILVEGKRTRTIGRVAMDMLFADVTGIPTAHVGSPVELWGDHIPVDEVAASAGTIGYELLCAIAPRVTMRDVA